MSNQVLPGDASPTYPRAKRARRGFTLIELLVVIAIIAILAAILFPVFARARENARRASCSSNMKQVGLGIMQYAQDFDEKYVPRYNNSPGQPSFRTLVQPYVKSTQLFKCPSNSSTRTDGAGISTNYVVNPRISGEIDRAISLSGINSVSQKVHVAELRDENWSDFGAGSWTAGQFSTYGYAGHLSTGVYLFADGHVKAMRPTQTATPFNMWGGMQGGATAGECADQPGNDWQGRGVNCDEVEATLLQGMQQLENNFK